MTYCLKKSSGAVAVMTATWVMEGGGHGDGRGSGIMVGAVILDLFSLEVVVMLVMSMMCLHTCLLG